MAEGRMLQRGARPPDAIFQVRSHRTEGHMHRALPIGVVLALLSVPALRAQTRPDFSGVWQMDASRSESAMHNPPTAAVTFVIAQTDKELTVQRREGERSSVLTYKLDGSENKLPDGTATSRWEGPVLVTDMVRTINGE